MWKNIQEIISSKDKYFHVKKFLRSKIGQKISILGIDHTKIIAVSENGVVVQFPTSGTTMLSFKAVDQRYPSREDFKDLGEELYYWVKAYETRI